MTTDDIIKRVKRLIVRKNTDGIGGIDTGWRVADLDGLTDEIWWGNTRDAASLRLLIIDLRAHGHEFEEPTDLEIMNCVV